MSGSYPGELYVFRGLEDGSFAASEKLVDAEGEVLNLGAASALHVVDWDADGDLDLLVGDIRGHVWWLANASGSEMLSLEPGVKLTAEGETIVVPHGDAGPVVVDWDENGTADLVVGCGDGSVRLYVNRAATGAPDLAAPVDLVPAPTGGMAIVEGDPIRAGSRAKPCVVDWDLDGDLDLLVGDVLSISEPPKTLTSEEQAAYERLQAKRNWVSARYRPAYDRVRLAVIAAMGVETEGLTGSEAYRRLTPDQRANFGKLYAEHLQRDIEAAALMRLMQDTNRAMSPYRPRRGVHGHVWVWLREPVAEVPEGSSIR